MNGLLLKVYERYDKKFAALGREYKYYGQLARDEIYVKDIRTFRLYNLINRRIEHYCQRNKKLTDEVNIPEIFTDMTGNLMMALLYLWQADSIPVLFDLPVFHNPYG
mgnify:CR=1 FL=1